MLVELFTFPSTIQDKFADIPLQRVLIVPKRDCLGDVPVGVLQIWAEN
jgi:hypothetical protein